MSSTRLILLVLTLTCAVHHIRSECCTGRSLAQCKPDGRPATAYTHLCGDCSIGTPYCAYGKCNIFGCACKNGCRKGGCTNGCGRGRRSLDFLIPHQGSSPPGTVIAGIDFDGDEMVSMEEARRWARNVTEMDQEFVRLDQDGDGHLTAKEIDSQ